VVLFTAAAAQDRVESFTSPADQVRFRHTLSERAGQILNRVVDASGVRRVVVAGGDTSSHGGRQLGIEALTFVSHIAPGAPLCRTWSQVNGRQGLEIVFKGGQCGAENFFEAVLNGTQGRS
jgi:3-oxoisoapionate kinase